MDRREIENVSISYIKILMLAVFYCFCQSAIAQEVTRPIILATHNLCPYGCFATEGPGLADAKRTKQDLSQFNGTAVDAVRCVFDKMDTPLTLKVVPWARAQNMAINGQADGFFAASSNEKRDQQGVKTDTIANQTWQWYLLLDNPLSAKQIDFKTVARVAGFYGSNMLHWLEQENYNVVSRPRNTEDLLNVLLLKRVDAVLANDQVMTALIRSYKTPIKLKAYASKDKPLGVYFSNNFVKQQPNFVDKFNSFLPICKIDN